MKLTKEQQEEKEKQEAEERRQQQQEIAVGKFDNKLTEILNSKSEGKSKVKVNEENNLYPTDDQLIESATKYKERFEPNITVLPEEHAAKVFGEAKEVDHIKKSLQYAVAKTKKQARPEALTYNLARQIFWNQYTLVVAREKKAKPENDPKLFSIFPDIVKWGIGDKTGKYDPERSLYMVGDLAIGKSAVAEALSMMTKYNAYNFDYHERTLQYRSLDEFYLNLITNSDLSGLDKFSKREGLVIDELSEKTFSYFHYGNEIKLASEIINSRHAIWKQTKKPTVITSNIPEIDLYKLLDNARLKSRIEQEYQFVKVEGTYKR